MDVKEADYNLRMKCSALRRRISEAENLGPESTVFGYEVQAAMEEKLITQLRKQLAFIEDNFEFISVIDNLVAQAHQNSKNHGFWDREKDKLFSVKIALMHSELSEALEADRDEDPPSTKIPGFTQREEELADVVIRVADSAGGFNLRLAEAILAKLEYNRSRPIKHGREY